MKLLTNLEIIRDHFLREVEMILSFIEEVEKFLTKKEEYLKEEVVMENKKYILHPKHRKVLAFLLALGIPLKGRERGVLAEMTLSHLISYQEAFIKEHLRIVLISHGSILKSKKKQLTYEEICKFQSIKSLISHMAQKEVDGLGYGSVDDVAKYFENQFNLSFEKFPNWQILREAAYRRNLIVHSSGVTNDAYCDKTGYEKKDEYLKTDTDYVKKICHLLCEFINFLHDEMIKKFKNISSSTI